MRSRSQVDSHRALYHPPADKDAEQIGTALDVAVSTNARPMSLGLGLLYTLLTVMHALVQPVPVRDPMVVIALGSALGLLSLHLTIRRRPVPAHWGNRLGASMAMVVLLNSLAHLVLSGDMKLTSNISILLIGIGAYFLHVRWFAGLSGVTLLAWGLVVAFIPNSGDIVHYAIWQAESLLVATVLFVTRSGLVARLARLHLQDERQKAELADAIRIAENNREAAEAASRAKSAFLANMSHEMRTPLTSILGYNELLQLQVGSEAQITSDLQKINQAGIHLLSLINNVLDLSQIEAGRMSLRLETFPIANVVNEVVTTAWPLVTKNSNILYTHLDEGLTSIYADRAKLRQILLNLVSNAAKFTEQGTITLAVWMEPAVEIQPDDDGADARSFAVFQVRDTGIGLSPEQINKLFVEFQQGEELSSHRYGGAGLGLALSRRLCRLMGGDIAGTGEPDHGATFTVRIPAHVQPVCDA